MVSEVTAIDPGVDGSLAGLLGVLGRTTDAMVAIDGGLRIVGWNEAATRLLGYSAGDALGRRCHEILGWRDRCGDIVCDGSCAASAPGEPDEVIESQDVLGHSADGKTLWLNASSIVPPPELREQCRVVHLVREIGLPPELERLVAERLEGWSPPNRGDGHLDALTPRERDVLQLLTEGLDGPAIADRLYLAPATVRNHIQRILSKLEVHSRVEAVAYALRGRRPG